MHLLNLKWLSWDDQSLGERFMDALKLLHYYLEKNHIPFFADPQENLLRGISPKTIKTVQRQLKEIIEKIEHNPERLWYYFEERPKKMQTDGC